MSNFYGKSAVSISAGANPRTVMDDALTTGGGGDGVSVATLQFRSDGTTYEGGVYGTAVVFTGNWVTPTSQASNYQIRATGSDPDLAGSALNTWLALSTTREWTVTKGDNTSGFVNATITIEIRDTATSTVRGTAVVTLEARLRS
jgi:hypothetical protein